MTNTDIMHTVIANTVETTDDTDDSIDIGDDTPIISPIVLHKLNENIHIRQRNIEGKNTTRIAKITKTPAPVLNRFILP